MNNNVDIASLSVIRDQLHISIRNLRKSIEAAHTKLLDTYGKDHECVLRIESYYSALEKQQEYAHDLDECIRTQNFENLQPLVTRINAISEMIKLDARSLLFMLQTGKDLMPDDVQFH